MCLVRWKKQAAQYSKISSLTTPTSVQTIRNKATVAAAVTVYCCISMNAAMAKQYNQSNHVAPQQRAKIDKAIAKSRVISGSTDEDEEAGAILSKGITRADCGRIDIGNIEAPKYGNRLPEIDRDIIITGDIINIATDCRNVKENDREDDTQ